MATVVPCTSEEWLAQLRAASAAATRPPKPLRWTSWIDTYGTMQPLTSPVPGKVRLFSYQRSALDIMYHIWITYMRLYGVWMKASRPGYTSMLDWLFSYFTHYYPANQLFINPRERDSDEFVRDRIDPLLSRPPLHGLVRARGFRGPDDTLTRKAFANCVAYFGNAGAAATLRAKSIDNVICDEVDAFPTDSQGEGDVLRLAQARLTQSLRPLMIVGSSPKLKSMSLIYREFLTTDQRYFFVPCPHCGHMQPLVWEQMKWPPGRPDEVEYICVECDRAIPHRHQRAMIDAGKWIPTADCADPARVGFQISLLYSCLPTFGWPQVVREYEAIDPQNEQEMKVFINTRLGLPYDDEINLDNLREKLVNERSGWDNGPQLPRDVLLLAGGVDVQNDRLEATLIGAAANNEFWVLDHQVFPGDTVTTEPWEALSNWLDLPRAHPSGRSLLVSAALVDYGQGGTRGRYARQFAREQRARYKRVYCCKGSGAPDYPFVQASSTRAADHRRKGERIFVVGDHESKAELQDRLALRGGRQRIHLSDHLRTPAYIDQILSERRQLVRTRTGKLRVQWVKKSTDANEALDCIRYAMAAVLGIFNGGLVGNTLTCRHREVWGEEDAT